MLRSLSAAFAVAGALAGPSAYGADLYEGNGLDIQWNNTLRYSAATRLSSPDAALISNPNGNEGDRNFAPGLISNRLDALSVLDVTAGEFGMQASVEAWYDTVYHQRTAVGTSFPAATRNLEGEYVDLADTFAYGNISVGDMPVTIRAGRQTLLWGESLFFDDSSIASAQAPVDYVRSLDAPSAYSNDVYLPVDQLSLVVQPRSDISFSAYYQFIWRGSRLPGVGSYFSTTNALGVGADQLVVGPGQFLQHGDDRKPNEGQFGASIHLTENDLALGFYALRYDAKYPVLVIVPFAGVPNTPGYSGKFYSVYPSGIQLYGLSFSTYAGDSNVAGEFAARLGVPLNEYGPSSSYSTKATQRLEDYASGDTLHAQISSVTTLPPVSGWNSADVSFELATNYILRVSENAPQIDLSQDRFAAKIRMLFEPHYFEVLPDLEVSVPVGLGYDISGQYSSSYVESAGAGDVEVGISGSYRSVWKADLTLTGFFGGAARQSLADRKFVAISLERTF